MRLRSEVSHEKMRYLWRTYQPPTDKIMNPSHLRTLLLSISVLLLTVSPRLLAQTPSDQYECLYRYHYSGPTTSAEEGDSGLDIMVAIMSAQEQHNESLPQELSTLVMLRMGDQRSYCRDYTAYRVDSLMVEKTRPDSLLQSLRMAAVDNLFYFDPCVTMDLGRGEMTLMETIPLSYYTYTEPMMSIDWTLSEETKEVCGYSCKTATGSYGGRTWVVRYAPGIPSAFGPWKLNGLPGLILEAEDTEGMHHFTAIRFAKATTPLPEPDRSMAIRTTRQDFIKAKSRQTEIPMDGITEMTVRSNDDGQRVVMINGFTLRPLVSTIQPLELK